MFSKSCADNNSHCLNNVRALFVLTVFQKIVQTVVFVAGIPRALIGKNGICFDGIMHDFGFFDSLIFR